MGCPSCVQALIRGDLEVLKDWCYEAVSLLDVLDEKQNTEIVLDCLKTSGCGLTDLSRCSI